LARSVPAGRARSSRIARACCQVSRAAAGWPAAAGRTVLSVLRRQPRRPDREASPARRCLGHQL